MTLMTAAELLSPDEASNLVAVATSKEIAVIGWLIWWIRDAARADAAATLFTLASSIRALPAAFARSSDNEVSINETFAIPFSRFSYFADKNCRYQKAVFGR